MRSGVSWLALFGAVLFVKLKWGEVQERGISLY